MDLNKGGFLFGCEFPAGKAWFLQTYLLLEINLGMFYAEANSSLLLWTGAFAQGMEKGLWLQELILK